MGFAALNMIRLGGLHATDKIDRLTWQSPYHTPTISNLHLFEEVNDRNWSGDQGF